VNVDCRENAESKARKGSRAIAASLENAVRMVHKVCREYRVVMVCLENVAFKAKKVCRVSVDCRGLKVLPAEMVKMVCRVKEVSRVRKDYRESVGYKDSKVQPVETVCLEKMV
jgi:hypothetical protein